MLSRPALHQTVPGDPIVRGDTVTGRQVLAQRVRAAPSGAGELSTRDPDRERGHGRRRRLWNSRDTAAVLVTHHPGPRPTVCDLVHAPATAAADSPTPEPPDAGCPPPSERQSTRSGSNCAHTARRSPTCAARTKNSANNSPDTSAPPPSHDRRDILIGYRRDMSSTPNMLLHNGYRSRSQGKADYAELGIGRRDRRPQARRPDRGCAMSVHRHRRTGGERPGRGVSGLCRTGRAHPDRPSPVPTARLGGRPRPVRPRRHPGGSRLRHQTGPCHGHDHHRPGRRHARELGRRRRGLRRRPDPAQHPSGPGSRICVGRRQQPTHPGRQRARGGSTT